MQIETLPGVGAEITGVDLKKLTDEEFAAVRKAYADHGDPHVRITPDTEAEAARTLARYHELGLPPLAERTAFLEDDGVGKFAASWRALLDAIEAKAGALTG